MSRLAAQIRPQQELSDAERLTLFELYQQYYEATTLELFQDDLAAKSHIIELHAASGLCGFSTLSIMDFEYEGVCDRAIFSGDTIIDQAHWGEQALVQAFCRFAGELSVSSGSRRLFWLLISKGYRTYRYLNTFAREYYPHHEGKEPEWMRRRMEYLARLKFNDEFDVNSGLVRFPQSRGQLRTAWAGIREPLLEHPAVRFFVLRNPRYWAGEELVCLTQLTPENLRSFARRAFLEGLGNRETHGARG